uniref:C-type lectin domain-containing protein n=1 Tax=Branchiostoma floridae TaxID=7739 RepID=C3ZF02_BRAFL|eukprot:XP_002593297.1 hypothetical protein BRAFLDRAFT_83844 [Branchiostoma floridae]
MEQDQTADDIANIPNPIYASSGTVNVTGHSEEIQKLTVRITEIEQGPKGQQASGHQDHQEREESSGLLGLREKRGPKRQLLVGLPDLQEQREPWGRLGLREKRGPKAQLLLGLLDLQEKREPRGQLALGIPDLLGHQERRDPEDQLLVGLPDLQEQREPWGQLALGLSGLPDHQERRDLLDLFRTGYWDGNGICYKTFDTPSDFNGAVRSCEQDGATLVMPRDAMSNVLVSFTPLETTWIGLHDRRKEGHFEWIDGAPLGHYNLWGPGQPDDGQGKEDCVEFAVNINQRWNDLSCDRRRPFICQVVPDLTTAIETQMQKLLACFKANDMKGVASLYTEDCKVMITGTDTLYGPEGAEKVHVGLWAGGVRTVEMETDEIGPMGSDVIYYRAAYTTKAEDGSVTDVGK